MTGCTLWTISFLMPGPNDVWHPALKSSDKGMSSITQLVGKNAVIFITVEQGLKWQWSPGTTSVKHWDTWLFSMNPGLTKNN